MKEQAIWAVKKGQEAWREEVIYSGPPLSKEMQAKCEQWIEENGFDRMRIASLDLTAPPNFTETVNL
jgi:hypothetical protein